MVNLTKEADLLSLSGVQHFAATIIEAKTHHIKVFG